MKKLFNNQKAPLVICFISIAVLLAVFIVLLITYTKGAANLATQQQWESGKDSFDKAYEIAAADKETPDKTLYVPKLTEMLGKKVDEVVSSLGQNAKIVSTATVGTDKDAVETETSILMINESGDNKSGSPIVKVGTNHKGIVTKATFECNTWVLGYGALSFTDLIENNNIVEKTLNEAGLNVERGIVKVPDSRSSYTTYQSDGTTVIKETCDFSGNFWQDGKKYNWTANVLYDYTNANSTGNLADTIRKIKISVAN